MNITLSGTKVSMDGHTLAFQKNNLVDSMVITVDTDETWQYKLDVKYPCKDSNGKELYNVIDLTRVGNTCTAILQASMLPFNGKYTMQLRGISGNKVYHTDTFDVWVKYSIDPGKVYDPVPSEFYQIEQAVTEQAANAKQSATNAAESAAKAEDAAVHSPIVGENGNWFIWDFTKSEYVDSGKPASTGGGSDLSLGITGATVGQIIKVKAVDADGKPTAWEAVDMDAEKFPKFTKLLTHTITQDELESSPVAFVWGTAQIPNLNDFNVFVLSIARPDGVQITFSKWVRLKINNTLMGSICGTSQAAEPQYVITANRLFGVWISGSYYNPKNISVPVLVPPQSSSTYQSNLPVSEPVTSIGFSSYNPDYGLTDGVVVEIWGAK